MFEAPRRPVFLPGGVRERCHDEVAVCAEKGAGICDGALRVKARAGDHQATDLAACAANQSRAICSMTPACPGRADASTAFTKLS